MRFISEKFAPVVMGLMIMCVMVSSIPIIVLLQKMPYESPQFWAVWRDTLGNTIPYAVPLAICTALVARLIVARFTK